MTARNSTDHQDVINVDEVRSHFPVLGGETIPFDNASGTVVLKEAIERYDTIPMTIASE